MKNGTISAATITHRTRTTGRYWSVPDNTLRVMRAHTLETAVDPSGKSTLRVSGAQKFRAHHRRKSQGDHAGHDDRAGQRKCELPEQCSRQPALDSDGRINRSQRDRHSDDRADELTRSLNRSTISGLAAVQVALDVFHHHDRIIDDQTYGEHNREQRQQVDGESGDEHQKHGANQAKWVSRRLG